jgi:hypothetical protein
LIRLPVGVAALLFAGCGATPEREANKAAGALIDMAPTREERAALKLARLEANAEMRQEAQALDEEIQRLREENAALEKKLENP